MEDICHIDTMLLGHTNTRTSKNNWVGNYVGVEAWIDIRGIPDLKKLGYHITYNSDGGYYFVTNRNTGVSTKFIEDDNGMPYVKAIKERVMFVQTARHNYYGFTKKEVEKYVLACEAPGLSGCPS